MIEKIYFLPIFHGLIDKLKFKLNYSIIFEKFDIDKILYLKNYKKFINSLLHAVCITFTSGYDFSIFEKLVGSVTKINYISRKGKIIMIHNKGETLINIKKIGLNLKVLNEIIN